MKLIYTEGGLVASGKRIKFAMSGLFFVFIFLLSGVFHQGAVVLSVIVFFLSLILDKKLKVTSVDKRIVFYATFFYSYVWAGQNTSLLLRVEELVKVASLVAIAFLANRLSTNLLLQLPRWFSILLLVTTPALLPFRLLEGRYMGFFEHPNHLAYVIVILCTYEILLAMIRRESIRWMIVLGLLIVLVLTKSSGGIVAMTIIILINQIALLKARPFKGLISFFGVLILGLIALTFTDVFDVLISKVEMVDLSVVADKIDRRDFGGYGSGVWRLVYWGAILDEFYRQPLLVNLLGHGAGAMSYDNYIYSFMTLDPHNDYIRLLVEYGVVGLFVFVMIWAYMLCRLRASISLCVMMFVPMFFGNVLVNFPYMLTLMIVLKALERADAYNAAHV